MSLAASRAGLSAWFPAARKPSFYRTGDLEDDGFRQPNAAAPRDSLFALVAGLLSPGTAAQCPALVREIGCGLRRGD